MAVRLRFSPYDPHGVGTLCCILGGVLSGSRNIATKAAPISIPTSDKVTARWRPVLRFSVADTGEYQFDVNMASPPFLKVSAYIAESGAKRNLRMTMDAVLHLDLNGLFRRKAQPTSAL